MHKDKNELTIEDSKLKCSKCNASQAVPVGTPKREIAIRDFVRAHKDH